MKYKGDNGLVLLVLLLILMFGMVIAAFPLDLGGPQ